MVEKLFYLDSTARECQTKVTAIHDNAVEVAATVFYPKGGGQPGDIGELLVGVHQCRVTDTRYTPDRLGIMHLLEAMPANLQIGDPVTLTLDWPRRFRHMRVHTAMHLLSALIPEAVTGGSLNEQQGRLDFDVQSSELDKEDLNRRLRELIERALPVSIESISEAELDANPGLVKTMSVQPPRGFGDIRMIRIAETDFQPCGGTHVSNTAEIGLVEVSKIRSKGRQNKRVVVQLME